MSVPMLPVTRSRLRLLLAHLVELTERTEMPAHVVALALSLSPEDARVEQRLELIADIADASAAHVRGATSGMWRARLLHRIALVARLLRITIDMIACGSPAARQVLGLTEQIVWSHSLLGDANPETPASASVRDHANRSPAEYPNY